MTPIDRIQCPAVPDLPAATWTNAYRVGRARREFFGDHTPTSTLVAVSGLVFPELCVEIDAWARLDVDLRQAVPLAAD